MSETHVHYAAYGSNLHPLRLMERVDSARLMAAVHVANYGLRWHKRGMDGSGKCDLVESEEGAWVAVFELSRAQLDGLDAFEGPGYRRVTITVPGVGDCLTYRARTSHVDTSLRPFGWYRMLVQRGSEYHGFPATYTDAIARVASMPDPDSARGARWHALAGSLQGAAQ